VLQKQALLPSSGKDPLTPYTELFSVTGHHRSLNLLRYAPENRSSPRAVTGKWLLGNQNLNRRLKIKTWTNPEIKNFNNLNTYVLVSFVVSLVFSV
jgi:hypothetical protein